MKKIFSFVGNKMLETLDFLVDNICLVAIVIILLLIGWGAVEMVRSNNEDQKKWIGEFSNLEITSILPYSDLDDLRKPHEGSAKTGFIVSFKPPIVVGKKSFEKVFVPSICHGFNQLIIAMSNPDKRYAAKFIQLKIDNGELEMAKSWVDVYKID